MKSSTKLLYQKAMAFYSTANQPFGQAELHRRAAKVKSKLDLLDITSIETARFRDGTYTGRSLGYAGDIEVTVTVRSGRMADIRLKHQEKIDLGACDIIPKRIIAKQSLKVDGITGATITHQAIVDGTLQALRRAGLK